MQPSQSTMKSRAPLAVCERCGIGPVGHLIAHSGLQCEGPAVLQVGAAALHRRRRGYAPSRTSGPLRSPASTPPSSRGCRRTGGCARSPHRSRPCGLSARQRSSPWSRRECSPCARYGLREPDQLLEVHDDRRAHPPTIARSCRCGEFCVAAAARRRAAPPRSAGSPARRCRPARCGRSRARRSRSSGSSRRRWRSCPWR